MSLQYIKSNKVMDCGENTEQSKNIVPLYFFPEDPGLDLLSSYYYQCKQQNAVKQPSVLKNADQHKIYPWTEN